MDGVPRLLGRAPVPEGAEEAPSAALVRAAHGDPREALGGVEVQEGGGLEVAALRERDEGRHEALVEQPLPEGAVRLDPADRGGDAGEVRLRPPARSGPACRGRGGTRPTGAGSTPGASRRLFPLRPQDLAHARPRGHPRDRPRDVAGEANEGERGKAHAGDDSSFTWSWMVTSFVIS